MATLTNTSDTGLTLAYNPAWTSYDPTCTPEAWSWQPATSEAGPITVQPGDSVEIDDNFAAVLSRLGGGGFVYTV